MKNLSSHYKEWMKRVSFPLFFVLCALVLLTVSLFKGQEHRRLISSVEEKIFDLTFFLVGPNASSESEKSFLIQSDHLKVDTYLKDLEKVYESHPQYLFLFLGEHLNKEETLPRIEFLANKYQKTHTVLTLDPKQRNKAEMFSPHSSLFYLENDPCERGVQRICPLDLRWADWMGVYLIKKFHPRGKINFLSKDLYRVFPSFLLYLKKTKARILNKNSLDLYVSKKPSFEGSSVFFEAYDPSESSDVEHYYSDPSYSLGHFWFDYYQQILEKDFIFVVESHLKYFCWGVFLLILLVGFFFVDSVGCFLLSLMVLCNLLFFNSLSVIFFRSYMPLATLFFLIISFSLIGSFLKLSYISFKKEVDLYREKERRELRRFRKIVISIISHNLNTPLAQIQGLLELVENHVFKKGGAVPEVYKLKCDLSQTYLSVKLFLTIISIQSSRVRKSRITFKEFLTYFEKESKLCVEKTRVTLSPHFNREALNSPMPGSPPVVVYTIFCFCSLFWSRGDFCHFDLKMSFDENSSLSSFLFQLVSTQPIRDDLYSTESQKVREGPFENSTENIVVKFLQTLKEIAEIKYFYQEEDSGKSSLSVQILFLN